MKPVGVLLVHGIGDQQPDWAQDAARQLTSRVMAALRRHLRSKAPVNPADVIALSPMYWADLLAERQRELEQALAAAFKPIASSSPFIAWFRSLWHRIRRKEFTFVSRFIADIIAYFDAETRKRVHERMADALTRLEPEPPDGRKRPLTIVAHSLGAVISSNYVWDQAKARRASGQKGFHPRWSFSNFFTLGSPMALFSLQYGGPSAFKQPVRLEDPRGRWVNLWDQDDPVGMPLKSLNEAYGEAVFQDLRVQTGGYLIAHEGYFKDGRTLELIARKLALDWIAEHGALPPGQLRALDLQYDKALEIRD